MRKLALTTGALALAAAGCADTPTASYGPVQAVVARTELCHFDIETGEYRWIFVPDGRAAEAHLAHGDGVPGGPVPGMDGYEFDENCVLVARFAIAYTDVDPTDGPGFKDGTDVLIAKLVDANTDGVLSHGDQVIMGRYPRDFGPTTFGDFGVTGHIVTHVPTADGTLVELVFHGAYTITFAADEIKEAYTEVDPLGGSWGAIDHYASLGVDQLYALGRSGIPSQPNDEFDLRTATGDHQNKFIDVDINF